MVKKQSTWVKVHTDGKIEIGSEDGEPMETAAEGEETEEQKPSKAKELSERISKLKPEGV